MKLLTILLFTLSSLFSFGQAVNRDVVVSFWNNNVKAIVDGNCEKIISQTNFPVEGSWIYILELEKEPENPDQAFFVANMEKIFDEETRKQLGEKTYNDLVHYKNDNGEIVFIINVDFWHTDPDTGNEYQSTTMFFFKMFDNKWKLYSIEFAG